MPVVTVSRQYAAGGSDIARMVSDRLGWPLIDNQFVERVAAQVGLPRQEVESREERVPSLIERLARALAISSPEAFIATAEPPDARFGTEEALVRATESVIRQAVQDEPHLVMVGRGAQACLASRDDSLHVFIVAPRETRIATASCRLAVARSKAEDTVDRTDDGRRRYVRAYYDRDW
ncbi:MAG: cytidylate kinase-like family protein, partial [Gemmatimonadales bacterium]